MNRKTAWGVVAVVAGGLASGVLACSGSDAKSVVTQKGRVIDFLPCSEKPQAVAGATVTIGTRTATTDADGRYAIEVDANKPFTMKLTKDGYVQLIEADNTIHDDIDRGDTKFISSDIANLLSSGLPSYDETKSLLTVELVKTGACSDLGGSTVTIDPPDPGALIQYPAACITPVGPNPYVTDGVFPAAVVYNLAPGAHKLTVTSPKCAQVAFPVTDAKTGLTYDGTVTTEAGKGTSFLRVFMQ